MVDFAWYCFKWSLVLGLVALVTAMPQLYRRVDGEIRCRVEKKLAEHYRDLKVTLRSAGLVEGKGITLRDFEISQPRIAGAAGELIHCNEVLLDCDTSLAELVQGEPQLRRIVLRQPHLRATRQADGSWSIAQLLPLPQFSQHPIETCIEDATIELVDPLKSPPSVFTVRGVQLHLGALEPAAAAAGYSPRARQFKGSFNADNLRSGEVHGIVDLDTGRWSIEGSLEGIDFSPELQQAIPEPLSAQLAEISGVRGFCSLTFSASCTGDGAPPQFAATGRLERGRIEDRRLPEPLSEVSGDFQLSPDGFQVTNLTGRCNQASIELRKYLQRGFGANSPKHIEAAVRQLELDRRVYLALPSALQQQWNKVNPSGTVDIDLTLDYDGRAWQPDLRLRCLSTTFAYYRFPLRLEEGKGTLTLKNDVLHVKMTAYSGSQPVELEAEVRSPYAAPYGWFQASGHALELDAKLAAALAVLSERSRGVYESLHPRGNIDFDVSVWRDASETATHKHVVLTPNGCSLQFEKFPYPVGDIIGTLEMVDDTWLFRELRGRNDTGRIVCNGGLMPTLHGNELKLQFTASDVPLDEELRDALRPNERQVWMTLNPHGDIQDLTADVTYNSDTKNLDVQVRAEPKSATTSVEPVQFPYRLEKLSGVLRYENGRVSLNQIRAEHGPVKLTTNGFCEFMPEGGWRFRLEDLYVERLRLDRELTQALPDRLRRSLVELRPSGPMTLSGDFELGSGQRASDPIRSQWDVTVQLQQGRVDAGMPLENIWGTLSLSGASDGNGLYSQGELSIDSLTCRDFQVTELRGPIWIDDKEVLLGAWAARKRNAAFPQLPPEMPRSLSAKLFGGTLTGDASVSFLPELHYRLAGNLAGADVRQCARDVGAGGQALQGTLTAAIDLFGKGRSVNDLTGHGSIHLQQADVYDLPLMVALLKILGVRVPESNAFGRSDVVFRIEAEHVYLEQIEFSGDTVSLTGKGDIDFQQNIRDMELHALVGRADTGLPLVQDLFSGVSRQIMVIHVSGTLQNPQTRREAFPGVNQALQQLQGTSSAAAAPPPAEASRWWRAPVEGTSPR